MGIASLYDTMNLSPDVVMTSKTAESPCPVCSSATMWLRLNRMHMS